METKEIKQPTQEELMMALANGIKERDKEIEELREINKNLRATIDELQSEPKPCEYQGMNKPWEDKVMEIYEHLKGEENYYVEKIKMLKHNIIECPNKKEGLEKKIKFNTAHLKKIRRLLKECIKG